MSPTTLDKPIREAFVSRTREVLERLAKFADDATIQESLSKADPLSGLLIVLERARVYDALHQDPLYQARVRGVNSRVRLAERGGGMLRLADAAKRLGVTPQAVTGRRARQTILAVPLQNGEWVYPVIQFTDSGLVPGLGKVLQEFKDVSSWTQLAVLLAPSASHGGRSALDLLVAGEPDAARSIAATYGEQG